MIFNLMEVFKEEVRQEEVVLTLMNLLLFLIMYQKALLQPRVPNLSFIGCTANPGKLLTS